MLEGRDLMGCAQTGTARPVRSRVPIIQRLARARAKGHHPCAHPHADARACAADLRKRVPVRALCAVQCGGHLRRRIAGAAGRGDRTRCGYSHCHAGPSVGSDGSEDRKAGQGRVFRARRGRPHARYGLFPDVKRIVKFLPKNDRPCCSRLPFRQRLPIWQRKCCMSRSISR